MGMETPINGLQPSNINRVLAKAILGVFVVLTISI